MSHVDHFQQLHTESACRSGCDQPTGLMTGGQYPKAWSAPLCLRTTLPADLLCWDAHALHTEASALPQHITICLCCWYLTLSPPPASSIPPPPLLCEDSSSTFALMFTLHCRKGLQSEGMEGRLRRPAIYSQSAHNKEVPWQITFEPHWLPR